MWNTIKKYLFFTLNLIISRISINLTIQDLKNKEKKKRQPVTPARLESVKLIKRFNIRFDV